MPGRAKSGVPTLSQPDRLHQTVRLANGRLLGYAEYGATTGPVLFFFHGLPGSRLDAPQLWSNAPVEARVVAPDRPGFGASTFQPGRRLLDWADDVAELADIIGADRFLVAGFSGGGPHALAVAHALPHRVIAAAIIGGAGPIDAADSLTGMNSANRLIFTLARRAPVALRVPIALHAYQMKRDPDKVLVRAASDKHLPEADREAMADAHLRGLMTTAGAEAFRQGSCGTVHEAHICAQPWGFDLAAIRTPVHIWHGEKDTNVPAAMAHTIAARIPASLLTLYRDEGHLIVPKHWNDILAWLLDAASGG